MLICPGRWCVSNLTAGGNGNFDGYVVNAWCARVRPSPAAVFGAIVGAGPVSVETGRRGVGIGKGSMNARVGGLVTLPPRAFAAALPKSPVPSNLESHPDNAVPPDAQ